MLSLIVKATELCNARCVYCDVVHKTPGTVPTMPARVLETVFIRINEFLLEYPDQGVEIIWHGGEPLLAGIDFFARAREYQHTHCAHTSHRVRHCVQTNLTLFNPEFADLLRSMGITSLGSSYEPLPDLRGLGRKRNWKTYNQKFLEGLRVVEQVGFQWGLIYVVTRHSLERPLELFHFLMNLKPNGQVMFNPVLIYGKEKESLAVTPREYVDFLGAIFPAWWKHRDRHPNLEPFRSITRNLVEGVRSLSCGESGNCHATHLNVAPDGGLSLCGRSSDWKLLDQGSLLDHSFSQALSHPEREVLRQRGRVLAQGQCLDCRFWNICHGGCPLDAWAEAGTFLARGPWGCARKEFIQEYFEPRSGVRFEPGVGSAPAADEPDPSRDANRPYTPHDQNLGRLGGEGKEVWINPIGGLGDTLMLSGVLKQVVDRDPSRVFNLVTRTNYGQILRGHPAIACIGHPPPGAAILGTDYWAHQDYGAAGPAGRAYQVLARMFGLANPVEERLYVPWELVDDQELMHSIPWKEVNVLICPASSSRRKEMHPRRWEELVELLRADGQGVVQAGTIHDHYIRGAHNFLGLTTPRQAISMLRRFQLVITADNFFMHAAHLLGIPAVVIWGPTHHRIYGYQGQIHLQAQPACDHAQGCVGPGRGYLYATPCPHGTSHCIDQIAIPDLHRAALEALKTSA